MTKFKVGDRVVHKEDTSLIGTVIALDGGWENGNWPVVCWDEDAYAQDPETLEKKEEANDEPHS